MTEDEREENLTKQISQGHPDPVIERGNLKITEENDNLIKGILYFKGLSRCDSKCGLQIEKGETVKVTFTELPDNEGTSVTNFIEDLSTMTYHQYLKDTPIESIEWVERYLPDKEYEYKKDNIRNIEDTLDRVILDFDGRRFSTPVWKRIKKN